MANAHQFAEPSDQLEVVRRGFRESEARVDDHLGERDAGFLGDCQAFAEAETYVLQQISVLRTYLVVHGNDAGSRVSGDHLGHPGVAAQSPDVIDDRRSGVERFSGNSGFACVDADWDVEPACEFADYWQDALEFD